MQIGVVGAGFVGTTTSLVLAEDGHDVTLVEVDDARRRALADGLVPFHEPGLQDLLEQVRDRVTVAESLAEPEDLVFVCVGTPAEDDGSADLTQLTSAVDDIADAAEAWDEPTVVVVKSTVPPGTTRREVRPRLEPLGDLGRDVGLAVNPEFLREGSALADARDPDRVVVGCFDELAEDRLRKLYEDRDTPVVFTSTPEAAETIKYASNALLATKIAFADELALLCERLGVDVDEVVEAVGMDHRIAPDFLHAGLGFGGSCFPKDLQALRRVADDLDVESRVLDAVLAHNDAQPLWAVQAARDVLGDLQGKRIAILGLAFKPGTSDIRNSRAAPIASALLDAGAEVVGHDPEAGEAFADLGLDVEIGDDVGAVLEGADACILQTAWPAYAEIPPGTFLDRMRRPVVLDGRRALDGEALSEAGVTYRGLGRGDIGSTTRDTDASAGGPPKP